MAVEAHHMNHFPSQLLADRRNLVNAGIMDSALPLPLPLPANPAIMLPEQFLLPCNYRSSFCDPNSAKSSLNKTDSGLTSYNLPRKRSRDLIGELNDVVNIPDDDGDDDRKKNRLQSSAVSFLDQYVVHQIRNQQSEIDHFVAQHTEKLRVEIEERRLRQSRILHSAIQESMAKRLKEKDEEIQKIGKLNWMLQERVKTLCVENQIWRELAHTNEATANSLRTNLEQVLAAHVADDRRTAAGGAAAPADDAESSFGSNEEARCTAEAGEDTAANGGDGGRGSGLGRLCKQCGERESIVLLLPCRHLCLCTTCGSTCRHCPVCRFGINASVHVNFS
ncbi:BOI-related E3 ubiquitin-protein ligase 1-like [Senna tora]|uniref:BOI-related E3 ubiquitin-protein ligase 1-like n=1 Tax=Senna tora TaxID=362788 RepID=A0A834SPV5_9FABA|nr:BOI-related E3 ubiquitin-protein ligase 1-like [Senna tora]